MEKLRFEFTLKGKKGDDKTNILCLTSISTPIGEIFDVPENLQDVNLHTELTRTDTFKKVKKVITKRHQKRNVWIILNKTLENIYVDDGGNIQFADFILEEKTEDTQATVQPSGISKEDLQMILENFSTTKITQKKNLNRLAEKFILEKFNNKTSNATQWMEFFESECERLNLQKDEEKIEILRLFLEGSCTDWYSSMLMKLTINSEWTIWKTNFCETHADKGWSPVKYAVSFRYMSGPLLDYALRKEKLLLEMDKSISPNMLINLIAAGLPDFVTDKINKAAMKETKDLFNEIRSLEHLVRNSAPDKKKNTSINLKEKQEKKKTCKICEKLGKKNRYHSEDLCWFKAKPHQTKEENQIKLINNSQLECELQDDNSKN